MKIKLINVAILLVTLIGTLIILSSLPDIVPVHFNFEGEADRWGSKYELIIMPVIMAIMLGIWFVTEATTVKKQLGSDDEKKRAEAVANQRVMNITFTIISVMFLIINFATIYMSYSQLDESHAVEIDILKIITIVIGVSFILMGNFMPKAKNNSNIGFRLPWTRFNDVTWRKSNLLAGVLMVIQGIIVTLAGIIFSGKVAMIIMLAVLLIVTPIMTIYAYVVYKDEEKKND